MAANHHQHTISVPLLLIGIATGLAVLWAVTMPARSPSPSVHAVFDADSFVKEREQIIARKAGIDHAEFRWEKVSHQDKIPALCGEFRDTTQASPQWYRFITAGNLHAAEFYPTEFQGEPLKLSSDGFKGLWRDVC